MRAYMSDVQGRAIAAQAWPIHTVRTVASVEAEMALVEARAILADVEPSDPGWTGYGDFSLPATISAGAPPYIHRTDSGRNALVDALALFLGQTFPGEVCRCAQGHHWSSERGYFDCGGIVPA